MLNGVTGLFNPNWFNWEGPYAILKSEHRQDFSETLVQKKKQDMEKLNNFMDRVQNGFADITLTDEQKAELAGKYDPTHMSDEAYKDFIDDLCKYGVLNEEDKPFVGYTNLIPLDLSEPEIKMIPLSVVSPSNGTDMLGWSKYYASFTTFNNDTQSYEKTRSAILYEKIYSILDQLSEM